MIERGGIFWADHGKPVGSAPAYRRPVVVVQADAANQSRLATVVVAALSSNTDLAQFSGNVFLPASATGLPKDSVVNVTSVWTFDREQLDGPVGHVPIDLMRRVNDGLRHILAL